MPVLMPMLLLQNIGVRFVGDRNYVQHSCRPNVASLPYYEVNDGHAICVGREVERQVCETCAEDEDNLEVEDQDDVVYPWLAALT